MVKRPEIPALTSLRFFAASLVVIFHYDRKEELFPTGLAHFGYESVAFFFILSGFVLTYAHALGPADPKLNVDNRAFLAARLARILPAYFVALAIASPFYFSAFAKDGVDRSLLALGAVLVPMLAQAWIPQVALFWNGPAWSLSNELFFYILYPSLWRRSARMPGLSLLCVACGALVAVEIVRASLPGRSPAMINFSEYFPLFNLPQFILGISLASIFIARPKLASVAYDIMLAVGIAAVAAIIAFKARVPLLGNTAILSLPFALIVFGAAGATGRLSKCLSMPALVLLGEASYALYILHVPIWMWWHRLNHVYLHYRASVVVDFALYASVILLSVFVVYVYIERPARRWLRNALSRNMMRKSGSADSIGTKSR